MSPMVYGDIKNPQESIKVDKGQHKALDFTHRNFKGDHTNTHLDLDSDNKGGKYCIDYSETSKRLDHNKILIFPKIGLFLRGGTEKELKKEIDYLPK